MIIPSIDIMNGKAVQLRQGKEKVIEQQNVIKLAKDFSRFGEIAVIDLDAALGKGDNTELIKQLCKIVPCRVGGGIRSIEKANELLATGAKKIIIGTKASPEFLKQLPRERVIVAVDTKEGNVVDKGWINNTGKKAKDVVVELEPYCSGYLFTQVEREGMMQGFDIDKIKELSTATKNKITAAGGITTIEDIKALESLGVDSQLGMALYSGAIKLDSAFVGVLDFEKNNGIIPTIVQDENGQVLMLAYSNKESLLKTFKTNKATYFSRSRNRLWVKGKTSGNVQEFFSVRYDCDCDTLLFTVNQTGVACHTGGYSCFGYRIFGLEKLYDVILDRIKNPKEGSYTTKICKDEKIILDKIREEAKEVIEYNDKENLTWEIADLTYFIIALMAKKGITINDIKNELWRRRK